MVPEARIELARGLTSTDFKSVASTNSATRAKTKKHKMVIPFMPVIRVLAARIIAGLYYQNLTRV